MSFLAPLFLFGALAVALPVLFHLIRRTTRERRVFSSLLFLFPSPPRLTRRSRLEHLVLLALRCAVLVLLAFGFARPYLRGVLSASSTPVGRRTLVLVDTSASLRRQGLWAAAREEADRVLRALGPADQAAVFTFDRQSTPVVTFEEWNATPVANRATLASGKMSALGPGWFETRLGKALVDAAELLSDDSSRRGDARVVVVSDLQEGCHLESLQGYEWPKGVEVSLHPLAAGLPDHASLQLVTDSEEADPKTATALRVRVANSAGARREQFKVGWATVEGFTDRPLEAYVPAGQSRIFPLPVSPGDLRSDRLRLEADAEDFDHTVFVVPPEAERLTVLYWGGEAATDPTQPLYFLRRVFPETRRQSVAVEACSPTEPAAESALRPAALLIVADALSEPVARALREQVVAGKTLLAVPKSAGGASGLAQLLGRPRLGMEETTVDALLGEIDFTHPLFAAFADPRFSDFTKIHFWKHRRIEDGALPGARVLARFDTGDPALLEMPVGKGRVLLLTSTWQPADSQLALSSKFVPLLCSLLEQSGAALPPLQYRVGDAIPLRAASDAGAAALAVVLPDGSRWPVPAGETQFTRAWTPGVYAVQGVSASRRVAVNLEPSESRLAPLVRDDFERLGVPLERGPGAIAGEARRRAEERDADRENRQKLWRWCLVGTLLLLLVETWFAGWTARRQTAEGTP